MARADNGERLVHERGVFGLRATLLKEKLDVIQGWRAEHLPATVLS